MKAKDFLHAMFGRGVYAPPYFIETRIFPPEWAYGAKKCTFHSSVESALRGVCNARKQTLDIYYGVLPRSIRNGSRNAIEQAAVVWCDIDVKTVGSYAQAIENLKPRLSGVAAPSIVVSSGNGVHAYWLLKQLAEVSAVESACKGIAACVGGDSVYDAPRILRVPGTWNYKDEQRRKCVKVVQYRPIEYHINDFSDVAIPTDIIEFDDIIQMDIDFDAMLNRLEYRWQSLIIHGVESEYAHEYNFDNSRLDFAVACRLLGLGIEPGQVATVFLNPGFGVSRKTLSKRGIYLTRYLSRTISRALQLVREEASYVNSESHGVRTGQAVLCG